jgi:hypothetical protein
MVIASNIVIAILHDTGKNEHTRVTFTNHYDHVIGHSYNRRPPSQGLSLITTTNQTILNVRCTYMIRSYTCHVIS